MTKSKQLLSSIQSDDDPVSLKSEMCKVGQRIKELRKLKAWLRSYPGDPDDTLHIRKDISKKISKAISATKELKLAYKGKRKPITKTGFNRTMKLYCPGLWDCPVKFER